MLFECVSGHGPPFPCLQVHSPAWVGQRTGWQSVLLVLLPSVGNPSKAARTFEGFIRGVRMNLVLHGIGIPCLWHPGNGHGAHRTDLDPQGQSCSLARPPTWLFLHVGCCASIQHAHASNSIPCPPIPRVMGVVVMDPTTTSLSIPGSPSPPLPFLSGSQCPPFGDPHMPPFRGWGPPTFPKVLVSNSKSTSTDAFEAR
eukprot:scaffold574_cov333-Pavlova_lutheri.AAC.22